MVAARMSHADRIFLETTRRLAPRRLAQDDVHAALQLAQVEPGKPVADLGCGYGRHLRELVQYGHRATGVDRSGLLLAEARAEAPGAALVRADLRALPLHQGSLAAAFCFYSSMFLGSEEDAALALVEAARVLRPGGALVLTTDNPLRLAASPHVKIEHEVPGLRRPPATARVSRPAGLRPRRGVWAPPARPRRPLARQAGAAPRPRAAP